MDSKKIKILIIAFIFIILPFKLLSAESETILLDHNLSSIDATPFLSFHEDKTAAMDFFDISRRAESLFTNQSQKVPAFGWTTSAIWLHFSYQIDESSPPIENQILLEIASPLLDQIDLYIVSNQNQPPDNHQKIIHKQGGDLLPFSSREVLNRNHVFILPKETLFVDSANKRNSNSAYYSVFIRIASESSIVIPIKIWSLSSFYQKDHHEQAILWLSFGIILSMIIYHFFISFTIRDRNYFLYLIFLTFVFFIHTGMHGFTYEYLWPNFPQWNHVSFQFFLSACITSGFLFYRDVLSLKEYGYFFYWFYSLGAVLFAVITLASFFISYRFISYRAFAIINNYALLLNGIIGITAGLFSYLKGFRPARFFLLAFLIYFLFVSITVISVTGAIPYNAFSKYAADIGVSLQLMLFSFALGDRINAFKKEKEKAQESLIETLRENEALKNALNRDLENKIIEKTQQLAESERRYRFLSEATLEGILIINDEYILDSNRAMSQLLGFFDHELIGRNWKEIFPLTYQSHLSIDNVNDSIKPIEMVLNHRDGMAIDVEVIIKTGKWQGDQARIAAIRDISKRKALEKIRQDLERVVHHDMRTPLAVIINHCDTLLIETVQAPFRDRIVFIRNKAKLLEFMVQNSLDFYQIERGSYVLQAQEFDLLLLLQSVVADLNTIFREKLLHWLIRIKTEEKWITIIHDIYTPQPKLIDSFFITGEKRLLENMFVNILQNAAQASPNSETIVITLEDDSEHWRIRIHNWGLIPEIARADIFKRQIISEKTNGFGLGAYSATLIARAHFGHIDFDSSPEKGTTIFITLPKD